MKLEAFCMQNILEGKVEGYLLLFVGVKIKIYSSRMMKFEIS